MQFSSASGTRTHKGHAAQQIFVPLQLSLPIQYCAGHATMNVCMSFCDCLWSGLSLDHIEIFEDIHQTSFPFYQGFTSCGCKFFRIISTQAHTCIASTHCLCKKQFCSGIVIKPQNNGTAPTFTITLARYQHINFRSKVLIKLCTINLAHLGLSAIVTT